MEHSVGSADSAVFLHLDVSPHEVEDKIEDGLEVALVFVGKAIGYAGEISLQARHCALEVFVVELLHKTYYEAIVVDRDGREIVGRQATKHAYLHFLVRIAQHVALRERTVFLYGEVATLIKQREGRRHLLGRHVEVVHTDALGFYIGDVDVILLQTLDEVTRCAGTEPIRFNLLTIERTYQTERIEYVF